MKKTSMMNTTMCCILLPSVTILLFVLQLPFTLAYSDFTDTFCQTEVFDAKCAEDEVVMMETALYGRMKSGRCVKQDYGFIGCSMDVLRLADLKCSGRQDCQIRIPDSNFDVTKPCPDDLKTYFQGTYSCLKVAAVKKELCQSSSYIKLSADHGYLSSAIAHDTGCGAGSSFWIIEAKPGQRVNLTVLDFSTSTLDNLSRSYLARSSSQIGTCRELFVVKDNSNSKRISNCNIREREAWVYTSVSNQVEIEFLPAPSGEFGVPQFLIHYTSSGCADPAVPDGGWIRREDHTATLGCTGSEASWRLECRDGKWIGGRGNCSGALVANGHGAMWNFMPLPDELSIFIIILIALFIGAVILGVGLFYVKRRNLQYRGRSPETAFGDVVYAPGTGKTAGGAPSSQQSSKTLKYDENEYALIWELQNTQAGGRGVDPYSRRPLPPYPPTNSGREDRPHHPPYQCAEPCQQCQLDSPKYFELDPKDHTGVGTGDPSDHRLGPHMMGHHST